LLPEQALYQLKRRLHSFLPFSLLVGRRFGDLVVHSGQAGRQLCHPGAFVTWLKSPTDSRLLGKLGGSRDQQLAFDVLDCSCTLLARMHIATASAAPLAAPD
jgi:hypothetical protein